jgi:hypothetical protein
MRLAIVQPYVFPYLGYFQLIHAVDKLVLFDDVNFINRGWVNRNNILVNGKPYLFTIPLTKASQNKKIRDIEVSRDAKWKEKLSRKIELAYKKAPFFDETFPLFQSVMSGSYRTIADLARSGIKAVARHLEMSTPIVDTSTIYENSSMRGQERILDICTKEGATVYINPAGGVALYQKEVFKEANIDLLFIKMGVVTYKQFQNEFSPNLSIIDVLMFNGKETVSKELLPHYTLH